MAPETPAFETPLWRALAAFRVVALAYAALLYLRVHDDYLRPAWGWAALAGMAVWTAVTVAAYARPRWRAWPLLSADVAVAAVAVLLTRLVDHPDRIADAQQTLPVIWPAAAVLACAVRGGPLYGGVAAAVLAVAAVIERGGFARQTVHNIVLLVLAGTIVGYAVSLVRESQQRLARALQVEAASAERERLARDIHDSVLQVLALVARRGAEAGGEAAELGRLAGKQESALRALVTSGRDDAPTPGGAGDQGAADLRALLAPYACARVTVSAPATAVLLDRAAAGELAAAVGAALHNVVQHAGGEARAWVLIEEEPAEVLVTVRDDGVGFDPATVASGRLGVSHSIRGRVGDLGGTTTLVSAPGRGTEVELRVPRRVRA